ncbi:MAG: relaxase/mobilization nuclease domain-containing protein, partial [Chitinophagaceae bacterium]
GENPGDKTMVEIAKKYLDEIGITDTQYVITKHTDKAHLHMHIIANMVDNNGNVIKDNWIGYRGKKSAQRLTQEYKLIPALKKDLTLTHMESLNATEANRYLIYSAITEHLPKCRNMEELEAKLKKQRIEIQYKLKAGTNEKQGISFRVGEYCFKGSKVDRKFSLGNLERTLALQQKQSLRPSWEDHPKLKNHNINVEQKFDPGYIKNPGNPAPNQKDYHQNQPAKTETILEALMKPEQAGNQLASELSQEDARQRKKKRSRRLRH